MRAVGVIPSNKEVRLVDHAPADIDQDLQVKVRSLEVGICGTDKEICAFEYGAPPPSSPYLVLGHESLGVVVEVGAGVSKVKPGDLVTPSVRRPCTHPHCRPCRTGRQDFCATGDFTERGIKMRHGYMTEFYLETEKYLTRVPPELREVGVLTEPLTVAEKALTQLWNIQKRLPWIVSDDPALPGKGLRAVVLGAGPVGILGAMALRTRGFETVMYSRAAKPNHKADLLESIGVPYFSSKQHSPQQLVEQIGNVDLVYEAAGVAQPAFELLQVLALNGIFIFTGIPAPKAPASIELDALMRKLVLKNQVVLGSVNADLNDFQGAVDDLEVFNQRWPDQLKGLITGRYTLDAFKEPLLGDGKGIKNVITLG
jgi:glucose 1-dehydrogenase